MPSTTGSAKGSTTSSSRSASTAIRRRRSCPTSISPRRGCGPQKHDLSHVPEKERQKARYKLDADYRKALLGEPMKLIEHIVRNDRPFTDIVTADYIMVTPYTARGYGIFDEVKAEV